MRLGDMEQATEAAQETFVRAFLGLSGLRKPEAFFAWLLGIADRVANETCRTAWRRRTVQLQQIESAEPSGKQDTRTDTAVAEAVARLPEVYREVVLLRFYAGRSCAEIGCDLDVPLGTVTKRLSRAYTLLRELLDPEFPQAENEVSQ